MFVALLSWECRPAEGRLVEGKVAITNLSAATMDGPPMEITLNEAPKDDVPGPQPAQWASGGILPKINFSGQISSLGFPI
jgi:hypothetical protein